MISFLGQQLILCVKNLQNSWEVSLNEYDGGAKLILGSSSKTIPKRYIYLSAKIYQGALEEV